MDKGKSKKGRHSDKQTSHHDVVVTHQKKETKNQGEDTRIKPKVPTEIIENPVDPQINPAKFVRNPSQQKEQPESATMTETQKTKPKTVKEHAIPTGYATQRKEQPDVAPPPMGSALKQSPQVTNQNQSGKWLVGIACLMSIFSLAVAFGAGFWVFGIQEKLSQFNLVVASDESMVKDVVEKAENALGSLTQLQKESQLQKAELIKLKTDIETAQNQLIFLSGKKEWVLNEVYQLLQNADSQLKINQDIKTAQTQLEVADQKLKTLGNPQLAWIRQALAKDIASLKSAPVLDKHGIWAKLSAFETQIYQLRFKPLVESDQGVEKNDEPKEEKASSWKKAALVSWEEFKSLIRVSRYDQDVLQPVLTDLEQAQLLRVLGLLIDQAQWAVLKNDSIVFHQSLGKLRLLVSQYFDPTPTRESLLDEVDKVAKVSLVDKVPDITTSLTALKNALENTGASDGQHGSAS